MNAAQVGLGHLKPLKQVDQLLTLDAAVRQAPGRVVAVGMAPPGAASRILVDRLGSAWTYARWSARGRPGPPELEEAGIPELGELVSSERELVIGASDGRAEGAEEQEGQSVAVTGGAPGATRRDVRRRDAVVQHTAFLGDAGPARAPEPCPRCVELLGRAPVSLTLPIWISTYIPTPSGVEHRGALGAMAVRFPLRLPAAQKAVA